MSYGWMEFIKSEKKLWMKMWKYVFGTFSSQLFSNLTNFVKQKLILEPKKSAKITIQIYRNWLCSKQVRAVAAQMSHHDCAQYIRRFFNSIEGIGDFF
jgi:hypothetical protein